MYVGLILFVMNRTSYIIRAYSSFSKGQKKKRKERKELAIVFRVWLAI